MADNEGARRDNGSDNRDRKRKWEKDGGGSKRNSRGRGGRSLQHGSRPDKKRNTGRTEHK
jgi:tRNA pseudouridine38-40 synthase